MFETTMVETGEGILAVEDKSGESMEQLLKHIYTGSTDNFNDLKVDVVLELLNASVKVLWELENTSQESLLNSIVLYQLIFVTCYDLHSTNFPS
jgi:fructose-bisphosphate aldolase class 1